jgi:1-acyl-sn-glycerol-3-phosphate acyltransferase
MRNRRERHSFRAYRWVNRLVKLTLGTYLRLRFKLRAEHLGLARRLEPPFLIVSNHVGYWDPFLLGLYIRPPVHFVAADANFRNGFMRVLLSVLGAIPKTKGVADMETVRHILHIRDAGGVIGVFPEGQRSWDGRTLPLLDSTAKLVRLAKVPVLTPLFKGGYLSHPRWARSPRRGRLTVQFQLGLTAAEASSLSSEEIHRRLTQLLDYDEHAYQQSAMIPFRGRHLAEHLEHVLFLCPHCDGIATLRSEEDRYSCEACGYTVRYDEHGTFSLMHPDGERLHFANVRDWHQWARTTFAEYLQLAAAAASESAILHDDRIVLRRGFRTSRMHTVGRGELCLYPDRMVFTDENAAGHVFPLNRLQGLNVQLKQKLELYLGEDLYTLDPEDPRTSMYKWEFAVNTLLGMGPGKSPGLSSAE